MTEAAALSRWSKKSDGRKFYVLTIFSPVGNCKTKVKNKTNVPNILSLIVNFKHIQHTHVVSLLQTLSMLLPNELNCHLMQLVAFILVHIKSFGKFFTELCQWLCWDTFVQHTTLSLIILSRLLFNKFTNIHSYNQTETHQPFNFTIFKWSLRHLAMG